TIRSRALSGPKDGTAPLNQSGWAVLLVARKATRRGQIEQSGAGSGVVARVLWARGIGLAKLRRSGFDQIL
ncbi:MAG TPA: hypothetical protein VN518_03055, partial [Methyloceanibacter sp.]|nr:hypothetical protein [Methyloceanibacter sp.]